MPLETTPDNGIPYHLLSFDKEGRERSDDPDGRTSQVLQEALQAPGITDVFLVSHGWQGDVPAARKQYNSWIDAMSAFPQGRERMRQRHPDFKPVLAGLHWPSKPWGDEEFGGSFSVNEESFSSGAISPIAALVDAYADRIADTPIAREALEVVLHSAAQQMRPPALPPAVREAYLALNEQAGLGAEGEGAAPGSDREPFDPEHSYQASRRAAPAFGAGGREGALSVLRQLSFWTMKSRARSIGEGSGQALLRQLQGAAPNARFHLMGHSFGCIVMSSLLRGQDGAPGLPRPVETLFLVQGALSLWSYCQDIPVAPGKPGYFQNVISDNKVKGSIVTTRSAHDLAVRRYYPLAAGARRQVDFDIAQLPKYGGVGTFGLRGPGLSTVDLPMQAVTEPYSFQPRTVYNLDANSYINKMDGAAGAHSDFAKQEVAHAYWEAARGV